MSLTGGTFERSAAYSSKCLTLVTYELETSTDVGGGEYPLLHPPTTQETTR